MGIDPLARAVFLDRDGVLNRALVRDGMPYAPRSLAELEILADVPAALAKLKAAGFLLIMVSNQPDVVRGFTPRAVVDQIRAALESALPLDDVFVCYHDDRDGCDCRKPRPGLILEAARKHGIRLSRSFMIGDRWRDIEAGRNAGCATVWIDRGYKEAAPAADARAHSLAEAADWILQRG